MGFTKRDAQKGADFVDQMKKICPSIGIQIRDPAIITLNDDRTETYVKVSYDRYSVFFAALPFSLWGFSVLFSLSLACLSFLSLSLSTFSVTALSSSFPSSISFPSSFSPFLFPFPPLVSSSFLFFLLQVSFLSALPASLLIVLPFSFLSPIFSIHSFLRKKTPSLISRR